MFPQRFELYPRWVDVEKVRFRLSPIEALDELFFVLSANVSIDNFHCAGGLSAVNDIGTQLRDPINSGLTRCVWRFLNK